jgi:hypothetical protein
MSTVLLAASWVTTCVGTLEGSVPTISPLFLTEAEDWTPATAIGYSVLLGSSLLKLNSSDNLSRGHLTELDVPSVPPNAPTAYGDEQFRQITPGQYCSVVWLWLRSYGHIISSTTPRH